MGAAPRILVVAGDAVEAAPRELALETGLPGNAVAIARSAVAGLSAARTDAFDVVVAGTGLPDGHELDVVRSLAAEPDSPPVVAMPGAGSERLAAAALAAGPRRPSPPAPTSPSRWPTAWPSPTVARCTRAAVAGWSSWGSDWTPRARSRACSTLPSPGLP